MAISGKYGKLHVPKIGEEEPVFILRAQDQLAVPAIEMYQLLAVSHGSSVAKSLRFFRDQARKKRPLRGNLICCFYPCQLSLPSA